MLPNYKVLSARLDYLNADEIRIMQDERLRAMVRYVYYHAPFFRAKLDAAGVRPADVRGRSDLELLPFCTKEELQTDQQLNPPFGSYTASHPSTWIKYFSTSGTTGRPLKRVFSRRDWTYLLERYMRSSTIQPGDISIILGPCDGFMGPTATMDSFAAQGAMVVPAGQMESLDKLKLILQLKPTSVSGTVSHLLYLGALAQQKGIDIAHLPFLKVITAVGEPGAAIPATRARLLDYWGNVHIHDAYGMTEFFPLAPNCHASASLHLANDFVIAEVVNPDTGEVLPEGQPGELVLTNIISDTQPLLRYRTRDLATLTSDTCECGMTCMRIKNGIEGRRDDMIWYKGTNIFPSAIEEVVRREECLSDEFLILLERKGERQTLTVQVQARLGLEKDKWDGVRQLLQQELHSAIKVKADVVVLPPGTLVTTQYKAKRVLDLRN